MIGCIYGVGVGPGDPELMTLKALRTIETCDAVLLPVRERENCRAYQIAVQAFPHLESKETYCLDFPMTNCPEVQETALAAAYAQTAELLRAGKRLAFLVIGDPSVYATFTYLARMAQADGFPVAVVSGVTSFSACAALWRAS